MLNFAILLDAIVLALFVYFVLETARQGFIMNVASSLRYIAAYFAAITLSGRCSQYIYSRFIAGKVEEQILEKILQFAGVAAGSLGGQELEAQVERIKRQLDFLNLDGFWESLNKFTPEAISRGVADTVVYPMVECLVGTVMFFVILKLCKIITTNLLFALKGINRIPIVGSLNYAMGVAFGLLKATIVTLVLAGVAGFTILASANKLTWLNTSVVTKTHLARYFVEASNIFGLDFNH